MHQESLDAFIDLARARRAVRDFKPDPLPDGVLDRLLEAARWAPSGYNLQPVHYVVVTDTQRRTSLRAACMDQRQVAEAPAVVVFAGDHGVARRHFERVLAMDKEAGATTPEYEAKLRKFVPLAFKTGPVGLNGLWKALLPPVLRWVVPIPNMPAVHRRYWLGKQVGLSAMNLMLAAHAAGLGSCPMEGFDTRRVSRLVGLPRGVEPMLVVPVGYLAKDGLVKTRLPLDDLVHRETWSG